MDVSFKAFLEPATDRLAYIDNWLSYYSIPHSIVTLAGKHHVIVKYPPEHYDPRFRRKTLVAHHDRVSGTAGANDNSAACFQLLQFAREMNTFEPFKGQSFAHNIRILFTDGEEAAGHNGIRGQGSYQLGMGLHHLGITDDDIFVFDATGCGDTLIVSTSGITEGNDTPLGDKLHTLHKKTIEIAKQVSPENWIRLLTPFSDNAGFLSAGIPAQVITILPHNEATELLMALTKGTEHEIQDIKHVILLNSSPLHNESHYNYIPSTWRRLHTSSDTISTLTKEAFQLIHSFLYELAKRQDLASEN